MIPLTQRYHLSANGRTKSSVTVQRLAEIVAAFEDPNSAVHIDQMNDDLGYRAENGTRAIELDHEEI